MPTAMSTQADEKIYMQASTPNYLQPKKEKKERKKKL